MSEHTAFLSEKSGPPVPEPTELDSVSALTAALSRCDEGSPDLPELSSLVDTTRVVRALAFGANLNSCERAWLAGRLDAALLGRISDQEFALLIEKFGCDMSLFVPPETDAGTAEVILARAIRVSTCLPPPDTCRMILQRLVTRPSTVEGLRAAVELMDRVPIAREYEMLGIIPTQHSLDPALVYVAGELLLEQDRRTFHSTQFLSLFLGKLARQEVAGARGLLSEFVQGTLDVVRATAEPDAVTLDRLSVALGRLRDSVREDSLIRSLKDLVRHENVLVRDDALVSLGRLVRVMRNQPGHEERLDEMRAFLIPPYPGNDDVGFPHIILGALEPADPQFRETVQSVIDSGALSPAVRAIFEGRLALGH